MMYKKIETHCRSRGTDVRDIHQLQDGPVSERRSGPEDGDRRAHPL